MRQGRYAQGGTPLAMQAGSWMTPNTMDSLPPKSQKALDHEHDTARQGRSNPNNLRDQAAVREGVTHWPTPAARDHKQFDGAGKKNPSRPRGLYLSIPQAQTTTPDGHACSHKCLRLNPLFVSYLMGLPPQWPDDSAPLATQSFRQWEASLGSYLAARKEGMLD